MTSLVFFASVLVHELDHSWVALRNAIEACPSVFAVSRLPALTWCDLGSPERVMRTLASTGLAPAWLAALGEPA